MLNQSASLDPKERNMTERSVTHATFVVERTYPTSPARVFAAWADPTIKARWFGAPGEGENGASEFDFRVGGREYSSGKAPNGLHYRYDARYQDIVPDRRIVYTYDMHLDAARISVSLATVEFTPAGAGTRLTVTEQGAYLDGLDTPAQREAGTNLLMDQLGEALKREATV
jgi:uncharacterized protein YndB with AHSA1/START domain